MLIKINYTPFTYQKEFHLNESRFKIIAGGRRVGKSVVALHQLIAHCLSTPNAVAWWVSPTYAEAREVGYETFKMHTEIEPAIAYKNDSQLKVKFTNGSTLYFKSADNEKSLRGRGLTYLAIDEAAFIKDVSIWKKVLRPALSDKRGSAVLISSPNGRNWFYQEYLDAKDKKDYKGRATWSYFHWPTCMNPIIHPDEIEMVKSELSDTDYRQEYLAEFVSPAGMVYDQFTDDNIITQFNLTEYHDVYVGADFGFANPSAILFFAYDRVNNTVSQFDEIYVARANMYEILQMIRQTLKTWVIKPSSVKVIYTDPAGNAAELTSGVSPVDYLRMEGDFTVRNKGSKIAPGIALVRSWIKTANGKRKFFVYNKCIETIRSLQGYCYEFSKFRSMINEEPVKDGLHDHACDALRYFFVNRFDSAKYVAKTLPQQSMYASSHKQNILKRCVVCRSPFVSKTLKSEPPYKCNGCEE